MVSILHQDPSTKQPEISQERFRSIEEKEILNSEILIIEITALLNVSLIPKDASGRRLWNKRNDNLWFKNS